MSIKTAKHRFTVLDAWRGVAACVVAVFHFSIWGGFTSHFDYFAFVQTAWLLVDFFFVLSGFVITHAALGKICDARTATSFLIRRFGRLWPLHVTILVAFVALTSANAVSHRAVLTFDSFHSRAFLYYLFMIQSISVPIAELWNTPAWSIGIEFYTYFVFAGVCLLTARRRFSTIGPSLILILLSLAMLIPGGTIQSLSIFRCIYGFFVGHLTYLIWCRIKSRLPLMEWLALAVTVTIVSFGGIKVLGFLAVFVFAFQVWVFSGEAGLISRLGKSAALQNLGAWSYSIYMTHYLALHVFMGFRTWIDVRFGTHSAFDNIWAGDAITLSFLAGVILVSSFTYRYIEIPAKKYFYAHAKGNGVGASKGSSTV